MYDQFYRFIARLLIDFLVSKQVKAGDKLELKLNTKDEIEAFHKVLQQQPESELFVYKTPDSEYKTICLNIQHKKVIIASDINAVQPAFLASLRNLVGTQHPLFADAGILFVHSSALDTLISGADKLQKEGMPLHYKNIEKHIQVTLEKQDLDEETKAIIQFVLSRQSEFSLQSSNYLAEYREIIQALSRGKVVKEQYEAFGLFYDSSLKTLDKKEQRVRLEENAKHYELAHNYHELNVEDPLIEKTFDKKGVSLMTATNWKSIDYKALKISSDKQKSILPIEYIENQTKETKEGLTYWEKAASDTIVGKRTRHIIVFNPEGYEEVTLAFKFSQTLKKTQCDLGSKAPGKVEVQGKQLQFSLPSKRSEVTYSKVKYKDQKNHEFRVMVIPFEEELFQDIKICYSLPTQLKQKGLQIQKDEATLTLGREGVEVEVVTLEKMNQEVICETTDKAYTIKSELENPDGEPIYIDVVLQGISIPFILSGEPVKPKPITAVKIEQLKAMYNASFTYHYNEETEGIKLFLGTEQYFAQEELLKQLKFEHAVIHTDAIAYKLQYNKVIPIDLAVKQPLQAAYQALTAYYRTRKLLPTLACMTQTLENLMQHYVKVYQDTLNALAEGSALSIEDKNLLKLGSLKDEEDTSILWSPLHPLNVAYLLQKYQLTKGELLEGTLLKKLTPAQLVPYMKDDEHRLYRVVEKGSTNWLSFEYQKYAQLSKTEEVIHTIDQTLQAFREQFRYLFHIENYPLTMNVVEAGEGVELIGGILRYLASRLKVEDKDQITPIHVTYYTKEKGRNLFHEIGHEDAGIIKLLQMYLPTIKEKDYPIYIKLLRDKVSIYKGVETHYQEAHITFVVCTADAELTYRNMDDIDTNLALQGLIGGLVGYAHEGTYVQTIGMKGIVQDTLIEIVRGVQALIHIGNTSDPYNRQTATTLVSSESKMNSYQAIECCSDWTVYIEPKATYSYFIQKEGSMIHYVNRSGSGDMIDALTLSKKVPLYTEAIWQVVHRLGIEVDHEALLPFIRLANVLNGEWLVELLSFRKTVGLDSIHTVALLKWVRQYLDPTYQYWIPISLADFLRTCEGLDIKSSKNDILWVGYRIDGTQIDVSLYPMHTEMNKTSNKLYQGLKEVVEAQTFTSRYFRQLILQKANSTAKLLSEQGFFPVPFELDEQIQYKLVNDHYQMAVDYQIIQGLQASICITDTYETGITREQTNLVIHTHLEAIWLEALGIQKIKSVVVEQPVNIDLPMDTDSHPQAAGTSELLSIEELAEVVPPIIEQPIYEVPIEAQYSIVYYMETLTEMGMQVIDNYLKQGIKPYLILATTQGLFEAFLGTRYAKYESLIKKQLLIVVYDAALEESHEEPYIADGQILDAGFYQELKQTPFNHEQYEIEHADLEQHMTIRAGAGTGKTKVMIDRIMYIKHMRPVVQLEDIAMITFTNESTMEMRDRLATRIAGYYEMTQDKKYLDWMDELASMQISTIHAFAKNMIACLGDELGIVGLEVTSYEHKKAQLIEQAIDAYSIEYREAYKTYAYIKHHELVKMILVLSNYLDNKGIDITSDQYQVDFGTANADTQHFFRFVLSNMQEQLVKHKEMTNTCEMNDLIKKLHELKQVEEVRDKCYFDYMMVDEFQDTDEVQVEFIAWLTNQIGSTLFAVGDTKQSIYRFRGADYTAFKQVEAKIEGTIIQKQLVKNYRSDQALMKAMNRLFGQIAEKVMQFEFEETDVLEATRRLEGSKGLEQVKLNHEEEKFIEVKKIYDEHKAQGVVCALVRTNKQLRQLAEVMELYKVPVIAKVKGSFYNTQAVRDFYQLVRVLLHPERVGEWVALDETPFGNEQFTLQALVQNYSPNEQYLLKMLRESEWYQALVAVSERCKYVLALHTVQQITTQLKPYQTCAKRYYVAMHTESTDEDALKQVALHKGKEYEANLNKLFYLLQKQFADEDLSLDGIEKFLRIKIATDRIEEAISLEVDERLQALRIMTVHQAKGLEFDTVVLPYTKRPFDSALNNDCIMRVEGMTHQLGYHLETKARTFENHYYGELIKEESQEQIAEETRLFYVACTRAKKDLYIMTDAYPSPISRINSWQDLVTKR